MQAEELIRKGVALRRQDKDLESYDYFRGAYELSPTPRSSVQLGLVEYKLGYWVEAESHLEKGAASTEDEFIKKNRETIAESLAVVRSNIGFIAVKGGPDGAEVSVNGRVVGKLPLSNLIKCGRGYAEVLVTAPGHLPARRTLTVQPHQTEQLFVALESASERQPAATVSHAPGTGKLAAEVAPTAAQPMRVAGLIVGLAGLAAAGYGAVQSYRVQTLNRRIWADDSTGVTHGQSTERRQWLAYAAGAAGLSTGVLLYWLGRPRPGNSASLGVAVTPGGATFMFSLRWAAHERRGAHRSVPGFGSGGSTK
jgi:hypothetical protein